MNTIKKIALAIVLVFVGGVNLLATDYLFGYGNSYFLAIPESASSGTCVSVNKPSPTTIQRCIWHCVTSNGSSGTATSLSSSTGYYLYVEINNTKYWLREANGNGGQIRYTNSSSSATKFIFNNYLAETGNYYVYFDKDDNTICTSSSSSYYGSTRLTIGSYACVNTSKVGNGKVYIKGDSSYGGEINLDSDYASRTAGQSGTLYFLNAQAASGYYFRGWSKTNSFSSLIDTLPVKAKAGRNENCVEMNESKGYYGTYYAMFAPYWKFSASGSSTIAGRGTVSATVTKSEVEATDNSTTTGSTTAKFTATPSTGYGFVGWTNSSSGTTVNQGTDNPKTVTITNSTPGSTASTALYAIFNPTYVVHFHPHNEMETGHSVTGSMADATFTCDIDGTLPANTFVNTISTTFDGNGGQLKNLSGTYVDSYTVTQNANFKEWTDKGSPAVTYIDQGTINRSGLTELDLYATWNNQKVVFPDGKRGDRTITKYNNGVTPGTVKYPNRSYTVTANWSDPFYAAMTATKTTGCDQTPTVDSAKKSSDYKGSNSGTATFALTAKAAKSGYHFTKWTGTGITFSAATSLTTNATVAVSSTAGESNAASYTATANYVQSTYYAALTATSGGNGTVTVDSSPKSTTTSGGDIDFNLTITPSSGYHFDKIEFTTGTGSITGSKVTVSASSNYAVEGDNKAAQYAVKVTFAKDMYNAQLTTAASTAGTGTATGTAQVSSDGGVSYSTSAKKSASTSGGDVVFRIKATPNTGYQFKGWSETNGSTTYKSTTAETDYTVKGHTTIGQTQSYNLYAVFNHGTYKIHFDANGGTGTMSDQNFTHGTAQKLTKNAFVNNFTVTYNTQGGTAISPETKGRFKEWSYNSLYYADNAEVNLTVAHNSTVTFKAVWYSSLSFTLPTPTKKAADGTAYTFLGWYDAPTGGNKVGDAGATVSISATRTLYAHWQDYNILIKANWSGIATDKKAVFTVQRSGNPAVKYFISIPIGGTIASATLKDVTPGEWTVTPLKEWTWNFNTPSSQKKTLTAGTNTFDFTFTTKASTKKNDEKSSQKGY